ncbi:MAG: metal ABC transporter ATP-binding protein [Actinobacteria bacterium]|nr:metal ABC transporter ATP-binding protein [Actinomycetota bacterium]
MSENCRVKEFFSAPPGESGPVIIYDDVTVSLEGRTVLEGITYSLDQGKFVGLVGPNGAGKTTLLRVTLGLVKPDKGTVLIMGMSPAELKHELHHIGYMPQQVLFDRYFPVSVFDVVMMGRSCCIGTLHRASKKDKDAVLESLQIVGLDDLAARPIGELSVGQQKRAFLARALCLETRILLLDEPTAGLDLPAQENFISLLSKLRNKMGLSVVFVSHDVNVLARFADEILCINRTMHLHGDPHEVLGSERLKEAYRCEFDFLAGIPGGKPEPGGG